MWPDDKQLDMKSLAKTHEFRFSKTSSIIYYKKQDLPWYRYSYYCRCEKGMYLKNAWTRGGFQLRHGEYYELLEAARQKNDNRIPVAA